MSYCAEIELYSESIQIQLRSYARAEIHFWRFGLKISDKDRNMG